MHGLMAAAAVVAAVGSYGCVTEQVVVYKVRCGRWFCHTYIHTAVTCSCIYTYLQNMAASTAVTQPIMAA